MSENLTGLRDPSGLTLANPIAATTTDETTTSHHADSWEMEGVQAWCNGFRASVGWRQTPPPLNLPTIVALQQS
jgi:hypothetical protein